MDVAATVSFERQQRVAPTTDSVNSLFQMPTSITLRNPFSELFTTQKKKTLAVIVSEYEHPKWRRDTMAAQA
ncbi:hypothetical protein KEM56_001361 [Ascosphaera pollenicola]|nr:hypothetical protein KEM56_001361 [Ascosphaera pollenicola]